MAMTTTMAPPLPGVQSTPPARRSRGLPPSLLLVVPLAIVFIVGFVLPLVLIARYAVADQSGEGWSVDQFATIALTPQYLTLIGRTLLLALISTVLAAIISYPLALAVVRGPRRLRGIFLVATTMPMLTSVVVKTFGWSVLLSGTGPIQAVLDAVGLDSVRLMFTPIGVVIGLTHTYFPFLALSLIAAIGAIDRRTEEAAL